MPSAIRTDRELSSLGLVTILVESQGNDDSKLDAFLWKTFPDNGWFVCTGTGLPIPPSRGIPHGALIGVDGTILWAGNPNAGKKQIETLVEQELEKLKKGWGATPDARKVRALLFGKGDYAGAMAIAVAINDEAERKLLTKEIEDRRAGATGAIAELKRQGRYIDAQERARQLARAVGDRAEWVEAAKLEVDAFATPQAKELLALDKKLEKVESQLRERKDETAQKTLVSMLKNAPESPVSARAKTLLAALQAKVE